MVRVRPLEIAAKDGVGSAIVVIIAVAGVIKTERRDIASGWIGVEGKCDVG